MKTVADDVWQILEALGISHVVGVAGTQTVSLLEALRSSPLRYISTNTELTASFLAGGFYRASGRPAVLLTIPGPGFTFALPGLAEARDDSAGLIYILPVREDPRPFASQQHPHGDIGELIAKQVLRIDDPADTVTVLLQAWEAATGGEPGPVIVIIPVEYLQKPSCVGTADAQSASIDGSDSGVARIAVDVADRLEAARKPLIFLGQGAAEAANSIRALVSTHQWPVITTTSGRGIVSESNPLVVAWECVVHGQLPIIQEVVAESDLIVIVGCKLSHNGSAGFQLDLPADKLVRIDASDDVLSAGQYPASIEGCASVSPFIDFLAKELEERNLRNAWQEAELDQWRVRLQKARGISSSLEPSMKAGAARVSMPEFFRKLRSLLDPRDVVVTDSGNHQNLTRRFFRVDEPRSLLCPINYQSMGFVLAAAMGACLAQPERRVVAVMGDGGLCMVGLELLTAVREGLDLTVVVLNDRRLSMIADHQVRRFGHEFGVDVVPPAMGPYAEAVGATYVQLDDDWEIQLDRAVKSPGVTLVEAVLELPEAINRRAGQARLVRRGKRLVKRVAGLLDNKTQ